MGLSLGLLGRGDSTRAWRYGIIHVLAAGVGGAVVGGVLGAVGTLLGIGQWRLWIVGITALIALGLALWLKTYQLGRQRQVPRRWARGTAPEKIYTLWGLMMGCGLYTPIYHTALMVLLAFQVTGSLGAGLASGFVFGIVRQATALWPVARHYDPEQTMSLLERLRPGARALNILLIAIALAALALQSR
ncbi:MAG: hypothetical protein ACR2J8_01985 [Thermomicrobiales bacterium]